MKVPFSWLKDYVDIDITAQELTDRLFSCGFEVEELIYVGLRSIGVWSAGSRAWKSIPMRTSSRSVI